ncbi:ChaN family lipoprotein [Candidatus Woesearchaeota archaeon]|nr:ChaN family lipoprotein [Candidatus Woesearchaeota archaeon]
MFFGYGEKIKMPSSAQLARRNLFKLIFKGALITSALFGAYSLFPKKEEAKLEKVVSDPEILTKYNDLLGKLKNGQITEYAHKETFDPYLGVWIEFRNYIESEEYKKGNFSKGFEIQKKYNSIYEKYVKSVLKPDTFSDVDNLEKFIQDNSISFYEVIDEISKRQVVLFGESHTTKSHDHLELRLIRCLNSKNLVCIHEFLQIDRTDLIKRYLDDDEAFEKLFDCFDSEEIKDRKYLSEFMGKLRKKKIPLVPADLMESIDKKFSNEKIGPSHDPRAIFIRDQLFTEQISYATKKGHRVFGVFGDFHVRPDHLPVYLRLKGIDPLVISGTYYTTEVHEAAMKVSGGAEVFFRRNSRIVYVTPQKKSFLRSKEDW